MGQENDLFVIKRDKDKHFSIVRLPWQERAFENYKEIDLLNTKIL